MSALYFRLYWTVTMALLVWLLARQCQGAESTNEVKQLRVHMLCPNAPAGVACAGEMFPTSSVITNNPPSYPHKCNVCGAMLTYLVVYPETRYIEVPYIASTTNQFIVIIKH